MLDHTTAVLGERVHLFDSNGSGVAIGDLDGDGRLDLAFANLDGPNTSVLEPGRSALPQAGAGRHQLPRGEHRRRRWRRPAGYRLHHRARGLGYWRNRRKRLRSVRRCRASCAGVRDGLGRSRRRWRARSGHRLVRRRAGEARRQRGSCSALAWASTITGSRATPSRRSGWPQAAERWRSPCPTSMAMAARYPGRQRFQPARRAWLQQDDGWAAGARRSRPSSENTMSLECRRYRQQWPPGDFRHRYEARTT